MSTPPSPPPAPGPTPRPPTAPLASTPDAEIELALALRAVMRTLAAMGVATVVLGLIAAGAAAMSRVENGGAGSDIVVPGLTVLMVGQLVALVATAIAGWVLIRLLRRQVPGPARAVAGLSRALGLCARILLGVLVIAVTVWVIARPAAVLSAVLGALVAAQLAVVIGAVRSSQLRTRAISAPDAPAAGPSARR